MIVLWTSVRRFGAARRAALPLEFALIGIGFTALVLVCAQLGFLLYVQLALDFAAREAGRQLLTGQLTPVPAKKEDFLSIAFCPYFTRFIECAGITVSLQPVADFKTHAVSYPAVVNGAANQAALGYDPGQSGSLMLLQAFYTSPLTAWPLNVTMLVGTSAFRNQ